MNQASSMSALAFAAGNTDPQNPGGSVRLVEKPVPEPGPGEVLVKIEAAVCNPSDIAALIGRYGVALRDGQAAGFEGCGRVVASKAGLMGSFLIGKRVACASQSGDGVWAEYAAIPARQCVPVGDGMAVESAATLIVNPFTSHAMLSDARKDRANTIIQSAGASQVGRGIIALARRWDIETISIVRRKEQADLLTSLGAPHVLSQSDPDFENQLAEICERLQPSHFFDAVGGMLTATVLSVMPRYSQCIVYGLLDLTDPPGGRFSTGDMIFKSHSIRSFWLTEHMIRSGLLGGLRASNAVLKLVREGVFETRVAEKAPIDRFAPAINDYVADMTAGKVLLVFGGEDGS